MRATLLVATAVFALAHGRARVAKLSHQCAHYGGQISGVAPDDPAPNPFQLFHTAQSRIAKTVRKCHAACCNAGDCSELATRARLCLKTALVLGHAIYFFPTPPPQAHGT